MYLYLFIMQSVVLQIKLLFLSVYKRTEILHLQAKHRVFHEKFISSWAIPCFSSTYFLHQTRLLTAASEEGASCSCGLLSDSSAILLVKATSCLLVSRYLNQNADTEWIFDAVRQQRTSNTKLTVSKQASLCKVWFSYSSFPPALHYRYTTTLS